MLNGSRPCLVEEPRIAHFDNTFRRQMINSEIGQYSEDIKRLQMDLEAEKERSARFEQVTSACEALGAPGACRLVVAGLKERLVFTGQARRRDGAGRVAGLVSTTQRRGGRCTGGYSRAERGGRSATDLCP